MLVCQFSGKTNRFDFFTPNLPKNGLRVGNSENYCRNNCKFLQIFVNDCKFYVYTCKCLILKKKRIRISILDIPCVPIFNQNEQLWLFWAKFAQKWILGSEFQKPCPDSESALPRNHVCQFSISLTFWAQIWPKMDFGVKISKI